MRVKNTSKRSVPATRRLGDVVVDAVRGTMRIRAVPRTGASAAAHLAQWREYTKGMNWLWRYYAWRIKHEALEAERPPFWTSRDIWWAAHAGTLFSIGTEDGKVIYSMASRAGVSKSLDVLSTTVGALLYRGERYWQPIAPGPNGRVLTMSEGIPQWLQPSAPGDVGASDVFIPAGTSVAHGSLAVHNDRLGNIKTLKMHPSSFCHLAVTLRRPANKTQCRITAYINFPSSSTTALVVLAFIVQSFNISEVPTASSEQRLGVGPTATDRFLSYECPDYFAVTGDYVAVEVGRRGEVAEDTYGDFVYLAGIRILFS